MLAVARPLVAPSLGRSRPPPGLTRPPLRLAARRRGHAPGPPRHDRLPCCCGRWCAGCGRSRSQPAPTPLGLRSAAACWRSPAARSSVSRSDSTAASSCASAARSRSSAARLAPPRPRRDRQRLPCGRCWPGCGRSRSMPEPRRPGHGRLPLADGRSPQDSLRFGQDRRPPRPARRPPGHADRPPGHAHPRPGRGRAVCNVTYARVGVGIAVCLRGPAGPIQASHGMGLCVRRYALSLILSLWHRTAFVADPNDTGLGAARCPTAEKSDLKSGAWNAVAASACESSP